MGEGRAARPGPPSAQAGRAMPAGRTFGAVAVLLRRSLSCVYGSAAGQARGGGAGRAHAVLHGVGTAPARLGHPAAHAGRRRRAAGPSYFTNTMLSMTTRPPTDAPAAVCTVMNCSLPSTASGDSLASGTLALAQSGTLKVFRGMR